MVVIPLRLRRSALRIALVLGVACAFEGTAHAQLGALVSPGALAGAHAQLEGLSNCSKCHEQGRRVTAQKCLACHQPIADRIARRTGVHRSVGGDCVACHADHAGKDGQLRPFDPTTFDHAASTPFPLDGLHRPLAARCESCHTTRSYLTASAACVSCHADVHKGSLGTSCQTCHSTSAAFKSASTTFDHSKAAFPLTGAHAKAACTKCHTDGAFKGVKFASCANCHTSGHRRNVGADCTSCHTTSSWRTTKIDHTKTAFPLEGKHVGVGCRDCHKQPLTAALKSETCAVCHEDVHRGSFARDCRSCHTVSGFGQAPYDHGQTRFALTGRHAGLACAACHSQAGPRPPPAEPVLTAVPAPRPASNAATDFRGLDVSCPSCHQDVHRGELGSSCETCHSSVSFELQNYTHRRPREFFDGRHAGVACDTCHLPVTREAVPTPATGARKRPSLGTALTATATTCVSCHADVHLGQLGRACESCHAIDRAKFAMPAFQHASSVFALTGRHAALECAACHKRETGSFPSGAGTAVRYKGTGTECRACHQDVHLGQVGDRCDTCHTSTSFKVERYTHSSRSLSGFFTGKHAAASCADCHKPVTAAFPAATGTAVRFRMNVSCVTCHSDIHRGALGSRCETCHRP